MSGEKRRLPKCVGDYDAGDDTCDGDPRGDTDEDKMPCVFRDRCAALQQHCKAKGHKPSDYVKQQKLEDDDGDARTYALAKATDDVFAAQLARWAKRWGVKDGKVTRKTPAKDVKTVAEHAPPAKPKDVRPRIPPTAAARTAAKAVIADNATKALDEARKMSDWFTLCLGENTERAVAERETAAVEGNLFVVDRIDSSRYAAVYCRLGKAKRIAIASIYPHTRAGTCQVRFPVDIGAFGEIAAEYTDKLGLEVIKDGRFKTRSGKLDKAGLAMASEAIAALIKQGSIKLPAE